MFHQEPTFDAENNEKPNVLPCSSSPVAPEHWVNMKT